MRFTLHYQIPNKILIMKKILLVISVVFLGCTSFAQSNIINETIFNKLVEYVSCQYANQSIQNYPNKNDKDNKAYTDSIKLKLDNCTLNDHLTQKDLYVLLDNNSWNGVARSLITNWSNKKRFKDVKGESNPYIIEYIVNIDGKFKTIIGEDFIKRTKDELLKKYVTVNKNKIATDSVIYTIGSKEKEEIIDDVVNVINTTHFNFSLWIVVLFEALFIMVLAVFLIKQNSNIKMRMESFKNEITKIEKNDKETIIQYVLHSKRIASKFKNNNGVEKFEDRFQQLDKRLEQLQFEVNNLMPSNAQSNQSEQKFTKLETEVLVSDLKYLKGKEGMILFKETTKENAFYEIFNIYENKACYRFCGDFGIAMANYDTMMKDVFNDEKTYSAKANQIINTKEGIVELRSDGKWEIKTPAKIKFI